MTMLVHSEGALLDLAGFAVEHARKLGAGASTVATSEFAGASLKVRDGAAENAVREGGQSLQITIFEQGRSGSASTEALDLRSIERTVEHACAIARQVEPDPEVGLADEAWLALTGEDVPLFAPSGDGAGDLLAHAIALETETRAAIAAGDGSARAEESGASSHEMRWARATSHGFARAASATMHGRHATVIAIDGDDMIQGWAWESDRVASALPSLAQIAAEAVEDAVGKLGARAIPTQSAPVLFEPRMAASLIDEVVSGLSGYPQYQASTFLHEALGTGRLAPHIDLIEDPFLPFGLASRAWDSEGVASLRRHIVEQGVVKGYFLSSRYARKLALAPTGSADGPGNLTLSSRSTDEGDDRAAMLRRLGRGLFVTGLMGGGANPVTGSYSRAAEGFWVEDGAIAFPVRDITIAGSLPDMLRDIVAVGADARRSGTITTGSILVPDMRIAS